MDDHHSKMSWISTNMIKTSYLEEDVEFSDFEDCKVDSWPQSG